MYIYHHWQGLRHKHKKIVIGLGNFDGLHIGHQKLISEIMLLSKEIGGTPAVFTFYPHPLAVLAPDNCPPMLLSQEEKRRLFESLGVEVLLLVPFNLEFARFSPEDFIRNVLNEDLGVSGVVVGYNFTFGYRGQGTPELLEEQSARYNYQARVVSPVVLNGQVVSSSLVRGLLSKGKVEEAAKFLGYYPFVEGDVVTGKKRGGVLGFPTANLDINKELLVPANGVYAVKVHVDGETYLGVANIGVKPTFQGQMRNIEVHLLDFYQDLYGKKIRVKFTRRLREERRFNTTSELVKQIEQDIIQTRLAVDSR
ncbi:MAG: bifunctional riboflavin kinase/FAD synthetase [Desulfotomaculaceae bacterium]|nr:bifunctional riboflavin kinase/FAD synthetase [Desulfotomaculaceae bacterium]